jgi:MYXO-CTERM domain-containing protein
MLTQLFTITKKPLHDLVAQTITPTPKIAHAGDKVAVNVIIANNGTFFEDFKLSLSYSPPSTIIGTKSNESISLGATSSEGFTWDTTGLSPGFYTLTANVTIIPSSNNPTGFENITSNNVAATQVQILGASSSVSPLLLVAGGTAAGVVALAVVGLLLRRRRRATASR